MTASPFWKVVLVMAAAFDGAVSLLSRSDLGAIWEGVHLTSRPQEHLLGDVKSHRSDSEALPSERFLIDFPDDAIMEFNFRLVVPYWSYPKVKTRGDYRLEVTYQLPNELIRLRNRRSLLTDRSAFYGLLSDFLTKAGLEGESCVERAVCEVGESPLDEYGILGEFVNLIFAAGYGGGGGGGRMEEQYVHAEDYGRTFGSCWSAFPDCPISLREMLHEFLLTNGNVPEHNEA